ncbi:MAG: hypothetical protein K2L49_03890 [Muribaculaceae bacterium]|nr:hypothetical protein [Muribaculaceae bacterium]
MNNNSISEPDNKQGQFEKALHLLNEKLTHFHCPICHAEQGISFIDDPFSIMHYNWIQHKDKPWTMDTSTGYGKDSVLGICNNCGFSMLFNVSMLLSPFHCLTVVKDSDHIRKIVRRIIEQQKKKQ